jgi:hypothetical protein
VVCAYIDVGLSTSTVGLDSASKPFSSNRAFLQWAGFTVGLSRSSTLQRGGAELPRRLFSAGRQGDGGWWVWAYTPPLGGGLSATTRPSTTAASQRRRRWLPSAGRGAGFGGWQAPEIVGNIHIEQAWGIAQIMATGHELNALYHGPLARIQRRESRGDEAGNRGNQDWLAAAQFRRAFPVARRTRLHHGDGGA